MKMLKKMTLVFLISVIFLLQISTTATATNEGVNGCYIATTECPSNYVEYARRNVSRFISSMDINDDYNSIYVGTPFAFADAESDVFYFPIVCDGSIKYLFRVYPDGNSLSAVMTDFLAKEIDKLACLSTSDAPIYLNRVDTKIVASIGSSEYILFEYPSYMSTSKEELSKTKISCDSVVNCKNRSDIQINYIINDVSKYISLNITETQGSNSWCTAYCLATIIRTRTSFTVTATGCMNIAVGSNPSTSTPFPWSKISTVANVYGLSPTVLTTTASNATLTAQLNAGRPCIAAMKNSSGTVRHAVVLRGYSSTGTWSIWNPWFSTYESYSMTGSYVPTGYSSSTYSLTPYWHAYNF